MTEKGEQALHALVDGAGVSDRGRGGGARGLVEYRRPGIRRRRAARHPATEEAIGLREDRYPDARLFAGSGADALRTSIGKACRAAGVPLFSPHDLRHRRISLLHRRISLLHLRGVPWARIGEFVGQRSLSVMADTYSHVLPDETELDHARLLAGQM